MVSGGANMRAAKTVLNGVNGRRNFRHYRVRSVSRDSSKILVDAGKNNLRSAIIKFIDDLF